MGSARGMPCFLLMLLGLHLIEAETESILGRIRRNAAGCGEDLVGTEGTFTLPTETCSFENSTFTCYSKNFHCEWTIKAPGHSVVMLSSDDFFLEQSADCQFDHVEIVEGDGATSRHCGWEPFIFISNNNQLKISFSSDDTYEGTGFTMAYRAYIPDTSTGCNTSITEGPDGSISNDNSADSSCFYAIQAPEGKVVQLDLTMISFDSHTCHEESLVIHPGMTSQPKAVLTLCSSTAIGPLSVLPSAVFIEYRNIIGSTGNRFTMTYSFVDPPPTPAPLPPSPVGGDPDCSGLETDVVEWTWTSPMYTPNKHCIIVVRDRQISRGVIQVTFEDFHLEESENCQFDQLVVKSGERNDSQELGGPYCGKTLKGKTFVTFGNSLRLEFRTDQSLSWSGVRAKIKVIPHGDCGFCRSGVCVTQNYEQQCIKGKQCDQNTCMNGGTCVKSKGTTTCYCVTGYSGPSCEQGRSVGVVILNPPQSRRVQEGDTVLEECGTDKIAYATDWYFNGQPLPEYDASNKFGSYENGLLQIDDISTKQDGWYTCIVRTDDGDVEHAFKISVTGRCDIAFEHFAGSSITKRVGDSVVLPCEAKNVKTIEWEKAASPESPFVELKADLKKYKMYKSKNRNFLQISDAQQSDEGVYRCKVEDFKNCIDNRETILRVYPATPYLKFCGQSKYKDKVTSLILNGDNARAGDYPWQVSFLNKTKKEAFCGGTLISNDYVLTAAHCIESTFSSSTVDLLFGSVVCNYSITTRSPDEVTIHPDYDKTAKFDSDIALIKLSSPVEYTDYIRPICLETEATSRNIFFNQRSATITGCGKYAVFSRGSLLLKEAIIPFVKSEDCKKQVDKWNQDHPDDKIDLTDKMLCAGSTIKNKENTCKGDSGGPLQMQDDERMFQIGIVSFGLKCSQQGLVGFYTNVPKFYDWIKDITNFDKQECINCDWAMT